MHLEVPVKSRLSLIPAGPPGIYATLKQMGQMVNDAKKTYTVINAATTRTRTCAQKDYACQVRMLHAYVRDSIQYVLDPNGVEMLQTPDVTLSRGAGDCDDKSILIASMLESIGHPTRFVAIGFEPGVFSHVYVETKIGSKWIPLETTEPVAAGWEPDPSTVKARMVYYN